MASNSLIIETDRTTPLVWFRIAIRGGTATDDVGAEGSARHAALLARRGAGGQTRAQIDESMDQLGASVGPRIARDAIGFTGVCLSRNLDAVMATASDVVCRPDWDADEHAKLVRESRSVLDDMRDDDDQLAVRFFARYVAPGHTYSRTTVGTTETLDNFDRQTIAAAFSKTTVNDNVLLGFAGDIDEGRALRLEASLRSGLGSGPAPTPPDVTAPSAPRQRKIYLIDKPERSQSQLLLGHVAPRYGSDDHTALIPAETIFGGMFTSRLNQQVRVKRGWSYGAGCTLERARGDYWFSMYLAPSADVTVPALELVLEQYEQLAKAGLDADEVAFAKSYLAGSMPFATATCRQRMNVTLGARLFGLPDDYRQQLGAQLAALSREQINEAARAWLRPDDLCVIIVATADDMLPRLHDRGFREIDVIPYDSY